MRSTSSFRNYLLLVSAAVIWGAQYILNKIALTCFSTSMIAAGRVGIGAIVLTLLVLAGGERVPSSKRSFWSHLPDFIIIGFFEATLPCIFVAWAQTRLASSVTAILIGTVPLFATLLEALFVKRNTISLTKLIAVLFGFLGVVILVAPELYNPQTSSASGSSLFLPVLAVLISALCFAMAMLLIETRLGGTLSPIRSAQGILTGAAITTIPFALWMAPPWHSTFFHPTTSAFVALITLGIFCGGVVYTLFVILINRAGPSFASMTNYLVPPIGAFIGIIFNGEKATFTLVASLAVILFSLWLSSRKK